MLKLALFLGGFLLLTIGVGLLGTIPPDEKPACSPPQAQMSEPAPCSQDR